RPPRMTTGSPLCISVLPGLPARLPRTFGPSDLTLLWWLLLSSGVLPVKGILRLRVKRGLPERATAPGGATVPRPRLWRFGPPSASLGGAPAPQIRHRPAAGVATHPGSAAAQPTTRRTNMAKKGAGEGVYRVIDVIGTSRTSWEDATKNAIE